MTRGQAKCTDNSEYLAFVRQNYLNRLKNSLPKNVLDKTSWQTPPAVLTEVQRSIPLHRKTVWTQNFILTLCMFLILSDIRDAAQDLLPSHGAEVCERNHTPEKSTGSTHVNIYMTESSYMFCSDSVYFLSFQLQLKVVTSSIFKGKKDNYPQSVPQPFVDTRISKY